MKLILIGLALVLPVAVCAQVSTSSKPKIERIDGAIATVTLSGSFTPKSVAVLFDKSDLALENGVPNTSLSTIDPERVLTKSDFMYSLNAAWTNASGDGFYIKKDPAFQRHLGAGGYYFVDGNEAHLQSPRVQTKDKVWPAGTEPKKLYVSWWFRQQNDTRDYFTYKLANVSDKFTPAEGDEFVVDVGAHYSGVTEVIGRVINYNPVTNVLAANYYGQNNTNRIDLKTLKLNKNGATAVLSEWVASQGSNKYIRVWEADGAEGAMRMSWTNTEIYVVELRGHNHSNVVPRQWNHLEVFVDQTKNTIRTKVNGKLDYEGVYAGAADKAGYAPSIGLIGFDSNQEMFQKVWMDDIYMDTSFRRVSLGNAPQYSAVTHEEVQYVDSWSTTEIKFTPNYGSLDRRVPAYVYVYDEEGVPNATGIAFESPIVMGASSSVAP